jgi:hypothetical protein
MQNPDLIRQIEGLARQDASASEGEASTAESKPIAPETEAVAQSKPTSAPLSGAGKREKRTRLLSALRPYVSEKRSKTLDTLMGAMDIFELIGKG